ncbi:MAG: hypothetical protein ACKO26_17795 [Planctomycetota bacterium]
MQDLPKSEHDGSQGSVANAVLEFWSMSTAARGFVASGTRERNKGGQIHEDCFARFHEKVIGLGTVQCKTRGMNLLEEFQERQD